MAVRIVVVAVLLAGPWTDQPSELSGWDAERFQEIADRQGAAWVDQPIEYPPGSVVVLDLLAGDDVVSTNRILIAASAALEALAVLVLLRRFGPRAAKAFLLVGLPLVPMGYLRLDLLVTVVATMAAAALLGDRRSGIDTGPTPSSTLTTRSTGANRALPAAVFATLAAVGAMIKIWPALLVAGAFSVGRYRSAAAGTALMAVFGFGWLALTGAGLEPLDQVLSLRGATGWHVESLPGSLVALLGDADPRLELNAFRIGTLNRSMVTGARALAIVAIVALAIAGRPAERELDRFALVLLGSVSALLVTAPLLSPQFLLWLTPWVALLLGARSNAVVPAALAIIAIVLTGFTLTVFGPANLAKTIPALILLIRNVALLAVPVACLIELRSNANAPVAG